MYVREKIALKAAQDSEYGNVVLLNQYRLSPNKMQVGFIKSLRQLIENGQNKALLISATGTGKTYASAFGIRDAIESNDKMLFLVHREQILLCPFHYFGITDLEIDGETVDEETGLRDFNRLTSDARVNYITEQIEYYGYSGERVKGLIFCSSKKEAVALSQIFNQRGYRTRALA